MPCLPNDFPGAVTTVPVLKNFMSLETEDVVAEEVPVALVYNGISHTVMMASPVMLEEFGTGFSLTEGIVESVSDIYDVEVIEACGSYNGISHTVMMASPVMLEEFGTGFSLTEGIVESVSDIYDVEVIEACGSGREVRLTISSEAFHNFKARRRAMLGRTGCGICGVESLGDALRPVPDLPATQTFDMRFYRDAVAQLKRFERIGALTGCTHASVWIRPDGTPAGGAEDVGRHVALDKLLGLRAREGWRDGALVVSSRASYEMVQKAAMCGVEILFALCRFGPHGARRENGRTLRDDACGLCTCGRSQRLHAPRTPRRGTGRKALRLTEPVRRKPLISMRGKAHKVFGRAVTLPYAHLHLFLHRRTSASCERSAESFSRKGSTSTATPPSVRPTTRRRRGWRGVCASAASLTSGCAALHLTEPVRRKPLILMGGKAHKVFGRAVTLPYAHLHLFLHRRTSASCERSAESFSRKGV